MPTIKDVAQAAGVSIATVSYVLNNKTEMVSAETARHVFETANRLGYRANVTARNLKSNRTGLIGYAWHTLPGEEPHWLMDRFIYHLAQAAESFEYHLLTFTHPYGSSVQVYDELILSGRLDGFVLSETNFGDPRIPFLLEREFPFVSFGRSDAGLEFPWIDTDSENGMRIAIDYLVDLGHRRIAFLGWDEASLTGNLRFSGYLHGMEAHGLPVRPDWIVRGVVEDEFVPAALQFWASLPLHEQPTAAAAVSDHMAMTAIQAAQQAGFQVGETLSIIGFDDAPIARFAHPPLTTLRQPLPLITETLMTMLDAILQRNSYAPPQRLFLPELIIRESCAAPQSG